jgi:16S rRNA (adenine1518-N6/adenine1519-N6)-dimethyltransferase
MILTVQREVAERICAQPGDLSLMALGVQVYGQSDIIARIPAGAFYPRPKVDSAVVRIDLFPQPRIPQDSIPLFFQLAKAGFSQKRKTLRNSLSGGMHWPKEKTKSVLQAAGIDSRRRAQSLSLEEWGDLTQTVTERQD